MSTTGGFAVPQNIKKKSKKAGKPNVGDAPIVLELFREPESGQYSLEFAGRKCK